MLRARLGLDSGQVSRTLRALEAEGPVTVTPSADDPERGATAAPHGAFVVAVLRGEAVGCGAVKHHPGGASDVKRMWLAETARGLGLGRRLLEHLEGLAREHGATEVRLETNDLLPEAIGLYRTGGPTAGSPSP